MKKYLGHFLFGLHLFAYHGIYNLLSLKLGVEEPFNVMAAASVTFGVYGFMTKKSYLV